MTAFTPEEDSRLIALIGERLSARDIASTLAEEGFPARTRNAILGRVHRLGLRLESVDARVQRGDDKPKSARLVPVARKPAPAKVHLRVAATLSAPAPAPEPAPPASLPSDRPGVAFRTTREGQCRWPLWADDAHPTETSAVCGEPAKPGQSYCPACYSRAYQPRPLSNLARHAASFARHDGTLRRAPARECAA